MARRTPQTTLAFDFTAPQPPPVAAAPVVEPVAEQVPEPPPQAPLPPTVTPSQRIKPMAKALREIAGRGRHLWDVYRDWLTLSACSVANSVDRTRAPAREAEYLRVAGTYQRRDLDGFGKLLGMLVLALDETVGGAMADVLGPLFHELELHNEQQGQFFTPGAVCQVIAECIFDEDLAKREIVDGKGFITLNEPACGSGAMILAFAQAMRRRGFNPQEQLHVIAQDLDERAAHMAFLQLSLAGIPAVVVRGDTLRMTEHDRWYTPMHVMGGGLGGWTWKLRAAERGAKEAA